MRNEMRQVQPRKSAPYSVIDGLKKCDAEFYGRWLSTAGRAERFWKRLLVEPKFAKRIEGLTCVFIPDFGIAATHILSALLRDGAPCAVNLWEEIREEFTMTVKIGFFAETQGRCCLGCPEQCVPKSSNRRRLRYRKPKIGIASYIPKRWLQQCRAPPQIVGCKQR